MPCWALQAALLAAPNKTVASLFEGLPCWNPYSADANLTQPATVSETELAQLKSHFWFYSGGGDFAYFPQAIAHKAATVLRGMKDVIMEVAIPSAARFVFESDNPSSHIHPVNFRYGWDAQMQDSDLSQVDGFHPHKLANSDNRIRARNALTECAGRLGH